MLSNIDPFGIFPPQNNVCLSLRYCLFFFTGSLSLCIRFSSATVLSLSLSHPLCFFPRAFTRLFIPRLFLSLSFCCGDWGWLCRAEQFLPLALSVPKVNYVLHFQSSEPLMWSARRGDRVGGKSNRLVPLKWFDLPLVWKVCAVSESAVLFLLCHCHFPEFDLE